MTTDANDPLAFARSLWGAFGLNLPTGMTPTFHPEELAKRIADMKTVEGWLKMNLSMLQTTIQGMELQLATLNTVSAMRDSLASATQSFSTGPDKGESTPKTSEPPDIPNPFLQAAQLWPWSFEKAENTAASQTTGAASSTSPKQDPEKPAPKKTAKASPSPDPQNPENPARKKGSPKKSL